MSLWANFPNILTIGRILLVPFTVWALVQDYHMAALLAFLTAGITDGLDGYLARRFKLQTELGAYLDPLADKALVVSVFVTMALLHILPQWLAILVVSRDLLIVSAVLLSRYLEKPLDIRPAMISKINTFAQIAFIVVSLASLALDVKLATLLTIAAILVSVLTVASFAVYMKLWLNHMADDTTGPKA
jgi:cardiolipin synthase (CMP-forming)